MSLFRLLLVSFLSIMCSAAAYAGNFAKPEGKPILVISGHIANTNVDGTAQFDLKMLEGLGIATIETKNPWYDGKTRFEGVELSKLMNFVGATGVTVTAVALNDYVSTIPMEDFTKFDVILAMKRDGNYMPVRDKGPLFIIYPYDTLPELQTQTYYTRSAWQVAKLIVE